MRLQLVIEGDDVAQERAELLDWLEQEHELRGKVGRQQVVPAPGEMGAITDVLIALVSSGGALTVLATSLKTFLEQPHRSDILITIKTPDGAEVKVDAKRVGNVEGLLKAVIERK